jgi:hypothetical protein
VNLFWILLILVGPFLVAAPGALFAAVEAPEFFTGRRARRPRYHWATT